MPRINVAPTRSNLIRIKKELQFAKEGYEILDRKREVLTTELVRVAHEAEQVQQEVWKLLGPGYSALQKARLTLGSDQLEWAALAANKTVDVHLKVRGIMGVAIPVIEALARFQPLFVDQQDPVSLRRAEALVALVPLELETQDALQRAMVAQAGELAR